MSRPGFFFILLIVLILMIPIYISQSDAGPPTEDEERKTVMIPNQTDHKTKRELLTYLEEELYLGMDQEAALYLLGHGYQPVLDVYLDKRNVWRYDLLVQANYNNDTSTYFIDETGLLQNEVGIQLYLFWNDVSKLSRYTLFFKDEAGHLQMMGLQANGMKVNDDFLQRIQQVADVEANLRELESPPVFSKALLHDEEALFTWVQRLEQWTNQALIHDGFLAEASAQYVIEELQRYYERSLAEKIFHQYYEHTAHGVYEFQPQESWGALSLLTQAHAFVAEEGEGVFRLMFSGQYGESLTGVVEEEYWVASAAPHLIAEVILKQSER